MKEEIWKDVPGYEKSYQISSFGRVKSLKRKASCDRGLSGVRERILKPRKNKKERAYLDVVFYKDGVRNKKRIHKLMQHVFMDDKKSSIDHINGDSCDNRLANLRVATHQQNMFNRRPVKSTTSKYKGVCWDKEIKKWKVCITIKKKTKSIGRFCDEIEAAKAYDKFAKKYHKEFARLNLR